MFPNLPTDNIFKVFFFGGLVLMVILITYSINSGERWEAEAHKYNQKRIEVIYEQKLDSLENAVLAKTIEHLKKDSAANLNYESTLKELEKDRFLIAQKKILKRKRTEEIELTYTEIKALEGNRKNDDDIGFPFGMGIAGLFILIGLIPWSSTQMEKESHEEKSRLKEVKNIPCQSCGMTLAHDFTPFMDVELCSNCFDGTQYKDPNLTLKEIRKKVEDRMKEQGIEEKWRKKHVKKLGTLNRWNQSLRW